MAETANLVVSISEKVFLNGYYRDSGIESTFSDVKGVDNRIVEVPSGSFTELVRFSSSLAGASSGTIQSDKLSYLRVSNLQETGSLILGLTTQQSFYDEVKLSPKTSYIITSTYVSGSNDQIQSLKAMVGSDYTSSVNLEFFIATT